MHHFSVTRTSLALGPVVLATILAGLVGFLSVARADWPMVRKDAQNSAATSVVSFNLPFVEKWEEPANGSVTPVLGDGAVFVWAATGNSVVAYELSDRSQRWSFSTGVLTLNGLAVSGTTLYVVAVNFSTGQNAIWAVSAATGAQIWKTDATDDPSLPPGTLDPPLIADGKIFSAIRGATAGVVALDTGSGALLRTYPISSPASPGQARPVQIAVSGGYLAVRTTSSGDTLAIFDVSSGSRVNSLNPTSAIANNGTAPVILGTTVYAAFDNGRIHAVDLATGNQKSWSPLFLNPSIGVVDVGRMAGSGNVLVVNGLTKVFAVDTTVGTILWDVTPFGTDPNTANIRDIAIVGDKVFVVGNDKVLKVLELSSGAELLSYQIDLGGSLGSNTWPIIVDDGNKLLVALRGSTGMVAMFGETASPPPPPSPEPAPEPSPSPSPEPPAPSPGPPPSSSTALRDPIVFVPGLGMSWNGNILRFALKPLSPVPGEWPWDDGGWRLFPNHIYDSLLSNLEFNGYRRGQDLQIAYYDWRASAEKSARKYLKPAIDEVKRRTGASRVDIVAHSMGGLVARAYIQGSSYTGDVDQLIMMGTPNAGASNAYLIWEGAMAPQNWGAGFNVGLQFWLWARSLQELSTPVRIVQRDLPGVKDLLPTYNFLRKDSRGEPVGLRGQNRNTLLDGLSGRSMNGVSISAVVGTNQPTLNVLDVRSPTLIERGLSKWLDGRPLSFSAPKNDRSGDGTVSADSAGAMGPVIDMSWWVLDIRN